MDDCMDDVQLHSSLCLVPICIGSMELKSKGILLTLVNSHPQQERRDNMGYRLEHAWVSVVETVHTSLLSAIQNVIQDMTDRSSEKTNPMVVARFGKVIFHGTHTLDQDRINENPVSESYVRNLKRIFYTDVSTEYVEHIRSVVVPLLGLHFQGEKELYHVKMVDVRRPGLIISCKCKVQNDEDKLELYKIDSDELRYVIVDVSCLESDVDLRLALCTKKIFSLPDDEEQTISDLISSAKLDPKVKGGLKWPLGKANSGGHYSIVGVWHTKDINYSNSIFRLKIREADRYDFFATIGEVKREIVLKLLGIRRNLLEQGNDVAGGLIMVEDALNLIKNYFLAWKGILVSCEA